MSDIKINIQKRANKTSKFGLNYGINHALKLACTVAKDIKHHKSRLKANPKLLKMLSQTGSRASTTPLKYHLGIYPICKTF